jgi:hypothetical protein
MIAGVIGGVTAAAETVATGATAAARGAKGATRLGRMSHSGNVIHEAVNSAFDASEFLGQGMEQVSGLRNTTQSLFTAGKTTLQYGKRGITKLGGTAKSMGGGIKAHHVFGALSFATDINQGVDLNKMQDQINELTMNVAAGALNAPKIIR